jgi:hypothetical protein
MEANYKKYFYESIILLIAFRMLFASLALISLSLEATYLPNASFTLVGADNWSLICLAIWTIPPFSLFSTFCLFFPGVVNRAVCTAGFSRFGLSSGLMETLLNCVVVATQKTAGYLRSPVLSQVLESGLHL